MTLEGTPPPPWRLGEVMRLIRGQGGPQGGPGGRDPPSPSRAPPTPLPPLPDPQATPRPSLLLASPRPLSLDLDLSDPLITLHPPLMTSEHALRATPPLPPPPGGSSGASMVSRAPPLPSRPLRGGCVTGNDFGRAARQRLPTHTPKSNILTVHLFASAVQYFSPLSCSERPVEKSVR